MFALDIDKCNNIHHHYHQKISQHHQLLHNYNCYTLITPNCIQMLLLLNVRIKKKSNVTKSAKKDSISREKQ